MSLLDQRCIDLLELMTAYLERELPEQERTAFETHLVYCPGCFSYLAQLRTTVSELHELPAEPVDAAEREALLAAFRDHAKAEPS
jgi:anti-sigma factor RsiW